MVNNVLIEYNKMKEEIKNPKKGVEKTIEMYCVSSRKTTVNKYSGIRRAKRDT